jgi:hypothetical protein
MKMPGDDELDTALAWLRSNEGDAGEAKRCNAVADWIEYQERERYLRKTARAAGIPLAALRRRLEQEENRKP